MHLCELEVSLVCIAVPKTVRAVGREGGREGEREGCLKKRCRWEQKTVRSEIMN